MGRPRNRAITVPHRVCDFCNRGIHPDELATTFHGFFSHRLACIECAERKVADILEWQRDSVDYLEEVFGA